MEKLVCLAYCLFLMSCIQESAHDQPAAARRQLDLSSDSIGITLSGEGAKPGTTPVTVVLKNSGTSVEHWEIEGGVPYIKPALAYGYLAPKEAASLVFIVDNWEFPAGIHPHVLKIRYATDSVLTLKLTFTVPEKRKLLVSPSTAPLIDYKMEGTRVTLGNAGNSPLRWQAAFDSTLLAMSPSSGLLAIGDSAVVMVSALRPAGTGDSARAKVNILANDFREYSADWVINTYQEKKQLLDYNLADAEYHRKLDRLVTVDSAETSRLRIHALPAGPVREIPLPKQAFCVSVNPAGTRAVAGHVKAFTLINLETFTVEKTFDVGLDVADILLTSDGWVYMVPRNGQHPPVTGFELATGKEVLGIGYTDAGATLRLHPSEKELFSSDNVGSPQDIGKYDITRGQPVFIHDSPYHGQYIYGGLFWLSEDGSQLFSSSGGRFRISDIIQDDLQYLGTFAGAGNIAWIEESLAAKRVFLARRQSPVLQLYAAGTYAPMDSIRVADFLEDLGGGKARRVASDPRMIFIRSDGKRIHVVMQAYSPTRPAFRPWAVQTLEIE